MESFDQVAPEEGQERKEQQGSPTSRELVFECADTRMDVRASIGTKTWFGVLKATKLGPLTVFVTLGCTLAYWLSTAIYACPFSLLLFFLQYSGHT